MQRAEGPHSQMGPAMYTKVCLGQQGRELDSQRKERTLGLK